MIFSMIGIDSNYAYRSEGTERKALLAEAANRILKSTRLERVEKTNLVSKDKNYVRLPYDFFQRILQLYTIDGNFRPIPKNYELSYENMCIYLFGRDLAKILLSIDPVSHSFKPPFIGIKGTLNIENRSLVQWILTTHYFDLAWRIAICMVFEKYKEQKFETPITDLLGRYFSHTLQKDDTNDKIHESLYEMIEGLWQINNHERIIRRMHIDQRVMDIYECLRGYFEEKIDPDYLEISEKLNEWYNDEYNATEEPEKRIKNLQLAINHIMQPYHLKYNTDTPPYIFFLLDSEAMAKVESAKPIKDDNNE